MGGGKGGRYGGLLPLPSPLLSAPHSAQVPVEISLMAMIALPFMRKDRCRVALPEETAFFYCPGVVRESISLSLSPRPSLALHKEAVLRLAHNSSSSSFLTFHEGEFA